MARALDKKSKKFNKMAVMRVYFGNWLRDYSQAVDLGTIKNVSYEAIRLVGGGNLFFFSFLFSSGNRSMDSLAKQRLTAS